MAIQAVDGAILIVGGAIATHADCCDECGSTCEGCEAGTFPTEIQAEIDTTAATVNPDYGPLTESNCSDGGCQALGGTFLLDQPIPDIVITQCGAASEALCLPSSTEELFFCGDSTDCCGLYGTGESPPCPCDSEFGTAECLSETYLVFIRIFKCSEDNHYYLEVGYNPFHPTGGFHSWQWYRDLGTTQPDCQDIFPMTLTGDDASGCNVIDACDFSGVTVTLTLP